MGWKLILMNREGPSRKMQAGSDALAQKLTYCSRLAVNGDSLHSGCLADFQTFSPHEMARTLFSASPECSCILFLFFRSWRPCTLVRPCCVIIRIFDGNINRSHGHRSSIRSYLLPATTTVIRTWLLHPAPFGAFHVL